MVTHKITIRPIEFEPRRCTKDFFGRMLADMHREIDLCRVVTVGITGALHPSSLLRMPSVESRFAGTSVWFSSVEVRAWQRAFDQRSN